MSTRTITITDEAYERLKSKKERLESFTDVILRITEKGDIMDFAGLLTENEADDLEKNVRAARKHSAARAEKSRERMGK